MLSMLSADTKALVTGGAGFIGSHLVERLLQRDAQVTVVDHLSTGRLENLQAVASRIDVEKRPLGEMLDDPDFVLGFDVIFHLAANAYVPPSVEDPSYDYALNLHTTFRLLEVLRHSDRRPRLVYASSAAVYGNPLRIPIRETDPTVPISPYGVSKLAAERYVAVFSQLYEIPASSVRLSSVYGPRQRKQVVYDLFDRLDANPRRLKVIGDGTQARDFTFVQDAVAAMMLVAERAPGSGEVYNVASGSSHSIAELVAGICDALGLQPEIEYTGKVRPGDPEKWSVDIAALRSLGYESRTTLAEGLRATGDWYRAERPS